MVRLRRWVASRLSSVEISESEGVRALHLGGDAIQSAMRLSSPESLELHYTRAMMGFLLITSEPRDVLLIGLGGGSLARFMRRHCPQTRIVAVEVNASVVAAARAWFGLPQDDDRLKVVVAEGGRYVAAHPDSCDALLLDAFDDGRAVRALCTLRSYERCYRALRRGGILVQNFMADEPRLDRYVKRLRQVFGPGVLLLPAANRVNTIVFAFKGEIEPIRLGSLQRRAAVLERRFGLPYRQMLRALRDENQDLQLIADHRVQR